MTTRALRVGIVRGDERGGEADNGEEDGNVAHPGVAPAERSERLPEARSEQHVARYGEPGQAPGRAEEQVHGDHEVAQHEGQDRCLVQPATV